MIHESRNHVVNCCFSLGVILNYVTQILEKKKTPPLPLPLQRTFKWKFEMNLRNISVAPSLTISLVSFLGAFDEQKNTAVYRNEFFGFKPSWLSVFQKFLWVSVSFWVFFKNFCEFLFFSPSDVHGIVEHHLKFTIVARAIRLYPIKYKWPLALRLEVYGFYMVKGMCPDIPIKIREKPCEGDGNCPLTNQQCYNDTSECIFFRRDSSFVTE